MGLIVDGIVDGKGTPQTDLGVQLMHLVTGEDYLGHIWFDPEDAQYIIERPILINMAFDQEKQRLQIAPMPLRPYLKKVQQLVLDTTHVIWILPVTDEMSQLWLQATSEVIVPSAGDLSRVLNPRS